MGDRTRKIKGTGSPQGHTGGYKPFIKNEKGAGHSKQPDGKSIGYGSRRSYKKGEATGDGRQPGQGYTAGDGPGGHGKAKHSSLAYNTNEGGKSSGVAGFGKGESFKGRLGRADSFRHVGGADGSAHTFRHTGGLKQGALRMSGDPRAHRVGNRGK